jgi:tRNA(Ile)-lysidine synthase TilS/MesJ
MGDIMINQAEESICREFSKKIWTKFRRGVRDYRLIQEGDRVAVCISGGKDSLLMALCIRRLQRNGEIPFEAEYIAMNPGYSEENLKKIEKHIEDIASLAASCNLSQSDIIEMITFIMEEKE